MSKSNETDKPAVDDLFARKLGNAVLPTSTDGFTRLQARMGQAKAKKEPGFLVWRNPNTQQFLALAACLLLVCLFGWIYLSGDASERVQSNQVATTTTKRPDTNVVPASPGNVTNAPATEQDVDLTLSPLIKAREEIRVATQPSGIRKERTGGLAQSRSVNTDMSNVNEANSIKSPEGAQSVAQSDGLENANSTEIAVVKPAAAHRVLVVTIAEPERLVAARQAVKMEVMETALASAALPEKTAKLGFWEQVRRVKQGEAFARPNNTDDERSLLNRAFDGLKNSIEKDKTARQ